VTDEVSGLGPDDARADTADGADSPAIVPTEPGLAAEDVATDGAAGHGVRTFGPLTYVGLTMWGVFLGVLGVGLAAVRTQVNGNFIPWGVALMLVALPVSARAAAWFVGSRSGAVAVGLAWVVPTILFSSTNPGGDVLLPDLTRTYVYLIGGSVLVLVACIWPLPRGTRAFVREGVVPQVVAAAESPHAGSEDLGGLQG
jgi:hypothetical protein